jgi:hypothetical protein
MLLTGAEQAILDHLAAGPGPGTWVSPRSPGGWVASTRHGGGGDADPATVQFRKSRTFPGCQLHEVGFVTRDGHPQGMLIRTWQEPGGAWVAAPIGGGGGGGPHRSKPWVNFAAQWNAHLLAAGGHVTGQGAESAHLVRLTFADGTAIDDVVENGVVLFFTTPGVAFPARVEILSAAGEVLAEYDEFDDLE